MGLFFLEGCNEAAKIIKCSCKATSATNMNDVSITGFVCITIIIIASIIAYTILKWKQKEIDAKAKERQTELSREQNASERKLSADQTSHDWQNEERQNKQKEDLLDKYLIFLKEQIQENEDKDRIEQYRITLEYLIQLSQNDKLNDFSISDLRNYFKQPETDEKKNT